MKTKTKSMLLLVSLIHHSLSAQTFYFNPYLALTVGDQKGVRITREQALEMMKLPSYRVELEKALNVDAEAFVKSGTSEFVPYEEYMVFLAAKNIKNVTDKAFIEGALTPNCDHLTCKSYDLI